MQQTVIIVAGGSGTRMGSDIPKQFLIIGKRPVLMHTIEAFYRFNPQMQRIVVLPASQMNRWEELCLFHHFTIPHDLAEGGNTRFQSVKNGLEKVRPGGLIGIHDGVRPLVSVETLKRCYDAALKNGNAVPVVNLTDSVRIITDEGSKAVDRSQYVLVQTPQVFQSEQLLPAYEVPFNAVFTDDASVVEYSGGKINLVGGNSENIKITTPMDLMIAEVLLKSSLKY